MQGSLWFACSAHSPQRPKQNLPPAFLTLSRGLMITPVRRADAAAGTCLIVVYQLADPFCVGASPPVENPDGLWLVERLVGRMHAGRCPEAMPGFYRLPRLPRRALVLVGERRERAARAAAVHVGGAGEGAYVPWARPLLVCAGCV